MKHVGILAHSFEGASLCFHEFCLEGTRQLGPHLHPEVTMTGVAMHHMLAAWDRNDFARIRSMLLDDIRKLETAGADFFICPDNTAHIALEHPGEPLPLPCLHIADVVAEEAGRRGFRKVAVLGTDWTMTGPVYPRAFERHKLAWGVPDEWQRLLVHRVILDELCLGRFEEESRKRFCEIIASLEADGCDCVALVCTEIPLLINDDVSVLPVLDSTRLLARAAVDVALGRRKMPKWFGGPAA